MSTIKLKKGRDLPMMGGIDASTAETQAQKAHLYAVVPDDFTGFVPRMEKKEGEAVRAGEALCHDKQLEQVKLVSPVSGTLKEVRRGERRHIEAIIIESDGEERAYEFDTKKAPKELFCESGLWAMMRQRPYDVVPNPDVKPRDIFVTAFDSAPLAPDLLRVVGEKAQYINKGVEALKAIGECEVHISVRAGMNIDAPAATMHVIEGPHPAGNVGVQIANIKPVNKGEVVWALDIVTLARMGELLSTGKVSHDTLVAVTGECVGTPHYAHAIMGCPINTLVDNVDDSKVRIISGNALTGIKETKDGWLHAPYRHVTVIPEVGKADEFMGWASLNPKRYSIYHLFPAWLRGSKKPAEFDARIKGGERAIVRSGEYDAMLPMDIYAEFLIKAIIAGDVEKMEQLGIYEVAPEDFALAEYADTSKLELQRIVREGLDKLRKEME